MADYQWNRIEKQITVSVLPRILEGKGKEVRGEEGDVVLRKKWEAGTSRVPRSLRVCHRAEAVEKELIDTGKAGRERYRVCFHFDLYGYLLPVPDEQIKHDRSVPTACAFPP